MNAALLLALGAALAAEVPSTPTSGWSVDAALTSEALGTVELRVRRGVGAVAVGAGVDLPVLLWTRGGPDTGRVAGSVEGVLRARRLFVVAGRAEARVGVQADLLGERVGLDVTVLVTPGVDLGPLALHLRTGWTQPLATAVFFSDYARVAFVDSGTPPPSDGVIPLGMGHGVVGVGLAVPLAVGWTFAGAVDGVLTPDRLGLGWEAELAAGVWPVRLRLGVRVALPGRAQIQARST